MQKGAFDFMTNETKLRLQGALALLALSRRGAVRRRGGARGADCGTGVVVR